MVIAYILFELSPAREQFHHSIHPPSSHRARKLRCDDICVHRADAGGIADHRGVARCRDNTNRSGGARGVCAVGQLCDERCGATCVAVFIFVPAACGGLCAARCGRVLALGDCVCVLVDIAARACVRGVLHGSGYAMVSHDVCLAERAEGSAARYELHAAVGRNIP